MNLRSLFTGTLRKALRKGAVIYAVLSALSTLFYCSCSSGTFYTLSSAEYMLEHSVDRQFLISSEYRHKPETRRYPGVPVYKVGEKYYVAAERVSAQRNKRLLTSVGSASPHPYYFYHREGKKEYYEVERSGCSGEFSFALPSTGGKLPSPAFTALSGETPSVLAYFSPEPSYPSVIPAGDTGRQAPTYTCEKSGDIQFRLTDSRERLSWRALYAFPAAAVLFVVVDIPFDLISFTGFCIRSIFD